MRLTIIAQLFVLVFGLQASVSGQEGAEFADGPIQVRREAIGELIRMTINSKRLSLKRDWGQKKTIEEKEDLLDAEVNRLTKKGFDPKQAEAVARRSLRGIDAFKSPVIKQFDKLKGERMRGGGSAGYSTSDTRISTHFNNSELSAKLLISGPDLKLSITENQEPGRELAVFDDGGGVFKIDYSGDDFDLKLRQKADGSIQLTRIRGEQADVFKGSNYISLRKEHPAVINEWLVPLLRHIGFSLPIVADDEPVQQAVLAKLVSMQSRSVQEFEKLLQELDSDDFQTREAATDKLADNAKIWQDMINEKIKAGVSSVEVRARLQNILVVEDQSGNLYDEVINTQGLMNSPKYLATLFSVANEQEKSAIGKQLEQLTNHSEPSPEAWLEWLSKNAGKKD